MIQKNWSWDTNQNMFDDVTDAYPMLAESVNEWHTIQVVYDDERYAVYHDNLKIYEWNWDDHPECGVPLDTYIGEELIYKGGYNIMMEMGLCGDWAHFGEPDWTGKFDIKDRVYDMQIDYIRVWETN